MPIPEKMSQSNLENYLELMLKKILEKIVEKNPHMKLSITPEKIKTLAQTTAKVMMQKGIEFSRTDVIDNNPKFIQTLTRALTLTAKLEDKDHLFKEVKEIFDLHGIKLEDLKKKSVKELAKEKKLTPLEELKLTLLMKHLQETVNDLQKLNLMKKTPTPAPGAPEPKVDPLIVELLGVLLEGQTGSIQPVVQQFNGNYLGITDKNPNSNDDLSQVGQQNRINFVFGDSLGIEHKTMENFEAIGGTFKDLVGEVHAEATRPKLTKNTGAT